MLTHRQRTLIIASAWLMALTAAPYATVVVYHYEHYHPEGVFAGSGFLATGIVLFTIAFLMLTMLATKLSSELDELQSALLHADSNASLLKGTCSEGLLPEGHDSGLRLLRMADDSPIRGKVAEKAIILSINGRCPSSAAEANNALTHGANKVEWADKKGTVHSTMFFDRGNDLKAQFEQVSRERLAHAAVIS